MGLVEEVLQDLQGWSLQHLIQLREHLDTLIQQREQERDSIRDYHADPHYQEYLWPTGAHPEDNYEQRESKTTQHTRSVYIPLDVGSSFFAVDADDIKDKLHSLLAELESEDKEIKQDMITRITNNDFELGIGLSQSIEEVLK